MGRLDEEALERKERRIPIGADAAFRAAFQTTLEFGISVLSMDRGQLVRLDPDGKREVLKWIGRRARVERGGKVPIQWQTAFPD